MQKLVAIVTATDDSYLEFNFLSNGILNIHSSCSAVCFRLPLADERVVRVSPYFVRTSDSICCCLLINGMNPALYHLSARTIS